MSGGLPVPGRPRSRRDFLLLAGATLAATRAGAAQIDRYPATATLPALSALDLAGRAVAVPMAGRATVVNFWASWCAPCRIEMPLLQQMAEFYGDRLALQPVNFKERAIAVERHVRAASWTVPVLLDPQGALAQAWGVKVFPSTFGFDAKGRPRWRVIGEYDWTGAEAGRLVDTLLG